MSPELAKDHWRPADGHVLPLRVWMPPEPPKAVVLALHGMNDYSNAFDMPGKALAQKGIATYAYDQRGFGLAPSVGKWAGAATMTDDLRALARLLHTRHPDAPLFVLGESMGGAVTAVALANDPPSEVTGAILSAPAVWGRSGMGVLQHAALWLAYRIAPGWTLTGKSLKIQPSDNIPMLRALSRDPLIIKGTRIDTIHGLVDMMDDAQTATARLYLPTLVLYGVNDQVIPALPTWASLRRLPNLGAGQRVALYDKGWHMLLRDLQAQTVIDDIAAWIADRTAPLPSGADRRGADWLAGSVPETR
ncbi:Lysophospholipase [Candidatus Terasakiella magnetica]|nr:Lysophospholipase [Candidatus Terasakiella magnetica]